MLLRLLAGQRETTARKQKSTVSFARSGQSELSKGAERGRAGERWWGVADAIDTGDYVRHGPTGENWVVACVDGDYLSWCGWPEGQAQLSDCTLTRKATPEERQKLLLEIASMHTDCHRKRHAVATLEREQAAGGSAAGSQK